jgi:hypothetical protein
MVKSEETRIYSKGELLIYGVCETNVPIRKEKWGQIPPSWKLRRKNVSFGKPVY